jgi:hypothetical protein
MMRSFGGARARQSARQFPICPITAAASGRKTVGDIAGTRRDGRAAGGGQITGLHGELSKRELRLFGHDPQIMVWRPDGTGGWTGNQ